jgi:hypothetical protein
LIRNISHSGQILSDFDEKVRKFSLLAPTSATWGSVEKLASTKVAEHNLASLLSAEERQAVSIAESSDGIFIVTSSRLLRVSFATGSLRLSSEVSLGPHEGGDRPWIGFVQKHLFLRFSTDSPGIFSEVDPVTLQTMRIWSQQEDSRVPPIGSSEQDVCLVYNDGLACIRVSPDGLGFSSRCELSELLQVALYWHLI